MGAVPMGTAGARVPPRLELADIVRVHGDAYRRAHRLAKVQHVALRAIAACRTALLGGHRETCERCGAVRITYNSCLMESAPFWGVPLTPRSRTLEVRLVLRIDYSP